MKRRSVKIVFFLFVIISINLYSRQWPDDFNNLSGYFAGSCNGSFCMGLEFNSSGKRIKPWGSGEIIWKSENNIRKADIPGRSLIVMEHEDGFRSVYLNVEKRPDIENKMSGNEWIGYSSGEPWIFEILDVKKDKLVNPVSLLPEVKHEEPEDTFMLSADGGKSIIRNNSVIEKGSKNIVVKHQYSGAVSLIPLEITLYWIGEKLGSYSFETLERVNEKVILGGSGNGEYRSVYDRSGNLIFRNVFLRSAKGKLELQISCENGKVFFYSWNVTVR